MTTDTDLLTLERIELADFWLSDQDWDWEAVRTCRAALREVQRLQPLEAENERLREALDTAACQFRAMASAMHFDKAVRNQLLLDAEEAESCLPKPSRNLQFLQSVKYPDRKALEGANPT